VLSATVISGRTYTFECCLFFDDSTAADGAQFDFAGGSAAATNFRAHAFAVNAAGASLAVTNAASTALATAIQVALALTTQAMIVIKGTFVPSGAGTFIVRAAQTAHTAGTLTVDRGSYLNIRDANPL
jgi:short subunit fatty acids transporter